MHQSSIAKIKRQYWDAINNDEMYPDSQPQKRGRVGSKLELTQEIERNIAKLNKKTKGRLGIRELAVAYKEEPKSTMRRYCFLIGMYNVDSYLKPHLSL